MNLLVFLFFFFFFINLKIKPDVTSIDFTTKKKIFAPFWYQNYKNCNCTAKKNRDMVEIFLKSPNVYVLHTYVI